MKISGIDKDFEDIIYYLDENGFKPFGSCDGVEKNHINPNEVTYAYISFLKSSRILSLMAEFLKDKETFEVTLKSEDHFKPYELYGNLISGTNYDVHFLNNNGENTEYFKRIIRSVVQKEDRVLESEERRKLSFLERILEENSDSDLVFQVVLNGRYQPSIGKQGKINELTVTTKTGEGKIEGNVMTQTQRDMKVLASLLSKKYNMTQVNEDTEEYPEAEFIVASDRDMCLIYFTDEHFMQILEKIQYIKQIARTLPTYEAKEWIGSDEELYEEMADASFSIEGEESSRVSVAESNSSKSTGLYFSNSYYRQKALQDAKKDHISKHSVQDALFLLIEGEKEEDLSNLCRLIQDYFSNISLSIEECYDLTQGKSIENKISFNETIKNIIYKLAYQCLESGKPLGENTIMDGKINTSHWMCHSLIEGKLAGQLAKKLGLDTAKAQKLGILHDYGRKMMQNAQHITRGYEALSDKGWELEAIGCLTHSFLAGGRCSWNDGAEEGFFVDDAGEAHWKEGAKKDDITIFLENYQFNEYDEILNIADLMATSYGIVSPAERIADIATRRKEFDMANRLYFLAELTNKLMEMLRNMGGEIPKDMKQEVKAAKGVTLEEITSKFERASEVFFEYYQRIFPSGEPKTSNTIQRREEER